MKTTRRKAAQKGRQAVRQCGGVAQKGHQVSLAKEQQERAVVGVEGERGRSKRKLSPKTEGSTQMKEYTHTHTHVYLCVCVCACVCLAGQRTTLSPDAVERREREWQGQGQGEGQGQGQGDCRLIMKATNTSCVTLAEQNKAGADMSNYLGDPIDYCCEPKRAPTLPPLPR